MNEAASHNEMGALAAIRTRRSSPRLVEPAPEGHELTAILEAAARAPDHGRLRPFRFTVLRGPAKEAFGAILEGAYRARCAQRGTEVVTAKADKERTKLGRAPLVVVVGARRVEPSAIPWVEQFAACAAACQNALLAATALGFGSMWRTGEPCCDTAIKAALGLEEHDAVVGFLYLGTPPEGSRPRVETASGHLHDLVQEWTA